MLQAELKVLGGKQAGKSIALGKKFLVGRESDCHLRPNSDMVSRHHCVFTLDDYTLRVRDLGSTNGTQVNDERLEGQRVLESGDRVRIGNLDFEIVLLQNEEAAAEPADDFNLDEDSRILTDADLEQSGSQTMVDVKLPLGNDPDVDSPTEQFSGQSSGDTGTIPTFDPNQQSQNPQQPWLNMPQQGYYPQYPPGYYPPQGMPYPPPGYPYYPQQSMPADQQQSPQQQPQQETPQAPEASGAMPSISLPDPAETGAKDVVVGSGGGAQKNKDSDDENPSNTAADLLNKMRQRR
ncbi:MAG: FHA domain-containing protein [Planctomycetaceae bacterium]|nr:FHA domain-containing protein [Planctomycetaceae bacterium]MDG2389653.1 FHA domain-containing protein [Planctomycetaceae bacterium]